MRSGCGAIEERPKACLSAFFLILDIRTLCPLTLIYWPPVRRAPIGCSDHKTRDISAVIGIMMSFNIHMVYMFNELPIRHWTCIPYDVSVIHWRIGNSLNKRYVIEHVYHMTYCLFNELPIRHWTCIPYDVSVIHWINECDKDYLTLIFLISYCNSLCGVVVRVPGYRSRGPGSIPGATRFSEK
jgi:hypothetical protein